MKVWFKKLFYRNFTQELDLAIEIQATSHLLCTYFATLNTKYMA